MNVLGVLVGILGLAILLTYYVLVWLKVGRDLHRGVTVPLYNPPEDMSPAEMRFIRIMGYDRLCLTVSILQLKILKAINIQKIGKTISLSLTGKNEESLSSIDCKIKNHIFASGVSVLLGQIDQTGVKKIIEEGVLEKYGSGFFKTNRSYSMKGFAMILIIFIITAAFNGDDRMLSIFVIVFLEIWGIVLMLLFFGMIEAWKMVYYGFESRTGSIIGAVLITLMEVAFFAPVLFFVNQLLKSGAWVIVLQIPFAVCIYFIFYELLKTRTEAGWKIMIQLEGFRMFLRATEEARLKLLASEGVERLDFDTYLPYALAFGIYKEEWVRRFKLFYEGGVQDK